MAERCDIAVIGGGHNGLATAALLAKAGRSVVVLERRAILGGLAAREEFHPGYRTAGVLHDSTGVSPQLVTELGLERLGLDRAPAPPCVYAPAAGGEGLVLHHRADHASAEIERHSRRDAERYFEYRIFIDRLGHVARRLIDGPPPDLFGSGRRSLFELLGHGLALKRLEREDLRRLLRVVPMSVADWLDEWFESDLLKSVLAMPALEATFTGPRSPGSNAVLLRRELLAAGGVAGGPAAFADTLVTAAKANGVRLRTGAEVEEILVSAGAVRGVRLAGGETIECAAVASSCDPRTTFLKLVSGRHLTPRLAHRITGFRAGGTTGVIRLALDRPLVFDGRPDAPMAFIRIGEHLDALERAFDPIKYREIPARPALDVHQVTVTDPALAPDGHAAVTILVHFAPYAPAGGWTDETRERLAEHVIARLEPFSSGVRASIVGREVLAPPDLEERYGLSGGHLHHGEHALDQLLVRPCPECARYRTPVEGLYLCGSGAHPGGGITGRPGRLAAAAVLAAR